MSMRRIPFPGPNGGSTYVVSSEPGGIVSRIADHVEEQQVDAARVFLAVLAPMLEARRLTAEQGMAMLEQMAKCMIDVVTVAESRGERLGIHDFGDDEDDE
ncbi:hypothetical protein ACFYWF_31565 [Streptomyces sp. NPDC003344]|uniref:hypothetical protein n=1 Tax=Streptomyces sp. NPDC003344 TaxID=3364682 RepID=UPI0036C66051